MGTLLTLAVLAAVALVVVAALAAVAFVIKTILWVALFPIRLLLKLIFGVLGAGLAAVFLPILVIGGVLLLVAAIVAALVGILAPILPIALVAFVGWMIYRASVRRPSPVI